MSSLEIDKDMDRSTVRYTEDKSAMYFLGIDGGASATKAVWINERCEIVFRTVTRTGASHGKAVQTLVTEAAHAGIDPEQVAYTVCTGYGRRNVPWATAVVTEITCHAAGVYYLHPTVRTIIEIGGQDCKVTCLDVNGQVTTFRMNDRCAAGSGRFLENTARALGIAVEELAELAAAAISKVPISSTCAVFAESEVVSHVARGAAVEDIVAGCHVAVADRVLSLVRAVDWKPDVAFTGGVALNYDMVKVMSERVGSPLIVPDLPQMTAALGAALLARRKWSAAHTVGASMANPKRG